MKSGRRKACRLSCPSWARTRTLLIQSQACCQLHQGAELVISGQCSVISGLVLALLFACESQASEHSPLTTDHCFMELRGIEPLTSALRTRRSPS